MAWRLSIKSEIQYRNIFCYWKLRIPPTHERWRRWRSLEAKTRSLWVKESFLLKKFQICRWGGWFWVRDWEKSWNGGSAQQHIFCAMFSHTSTIDNEQETSSLDGNSIRFFAFNVKSFRCFLPSHSSKAVPNLHHFHINYQIICFYQSICSARKSHLIMTTIKHSRNTSPGIHNTTLWLGFT